MKENSILTALTVIVGLFAVYLWTNNLLFGQILFVFGVLLVLSKWVREILHTFWMFLTKILGYIMPNILLSLVFFLVVTPLGLLTRLFKVNSQFKLKNNAPSFFVQMDTEFTKKSFENPW